MEHTILSILEKCDSKLFAKLWLFYRDFFDTDEIRFEFLQSVFAKEPKRDNELKYTFDEQINIGQQSFFIPRRMVNLTLRLVTAARDMEQIRNGKDVFKIVYLVSCIESLQLLRGKRNFHKWEMIQDFFVNFISASDKEKLLKCFKRSLGDCMYDVNKADSNQNWPDELITIEEFAEIINELRNCASHEGEYWNLSFCSRHDCDSWMQVFVVIDLKRYTTFNGEQIHRYETNLTYCDFESIFIRSCIQFIKEYININH